MGYTIPLGSIKNIRYGIGLQRSAISPNVTGGTTEKTAYGSYI